MTSLPSRESILDDAIITSDWKAYYGDIRDYVSLLPFAQVAKEVTIVNNSITVNSSANKILAESNSPTTIDNIKTDGLQDSQLLLLYKGNEEHSISLKNGSVGDGSIVTLENKDVPLSLDFPIILQRDGNNWKQIDIIGSFRATDEDIVEGISKIKFPTVEQMKPYMGTAISAQLGVIIYCMKPAAGCLECNDQEHQGDTYKTLYEAIVDGTLPSVSYSEYQSQTSSKGFCDKFGLDSDNGKFKCPNLASVKFGETTYKAYVGAWNTSEKNVMDLQGILDKCLVVQTEINEKGEEIKSYVEQSLQQLEELKNSSIQEITQTKTSALEEINAQETSAIEDIEQKRLDSINSLESKRLEINSVGQGEIDRLNALSTSLTNSFNTNAQEKQASVDASAEEARKWAIGTEEERPEGSAHYWANVAKGQTIPNQDGNNGKFLATDGSKVYWENALDYADITNCITKIPNDIKLELSNGTLTLKAGSKVYVPNGVGVFDEYIVQSDISITDTLPRTMVLFVNNSGVNLYYNITDTYSGDTQPSIGQFAVWYDTANNIIKSTSDNGSSWIDGWSLPICIMTSASTNGFTSIDQVFNGFGYIGRTVFALPGVEGLIPNGRNADGSLNNIKFVTTSVLTFNNQVSLNDLTMLIGVSELAEGYVQYNGNTNFVEDNNGNISFIEFGKVSRQDGRITSFSPKNVFTAVDRNDTEWLSGLGSPSERYIEIDVSGNSLKYTPPAYGYIVAQTPDSGTNGTLEIQQGQMMSRINLGITVNTTSFIKVTKRKTVYVNCDLGIKRCVFIYAEGSK